MTEIPKDVRKRAADAWHEVGRRQLRNDFAGAEDVIATLLHAAILAERQRCAGIADKYASDDGHSGDVRLCAAYIRREIQYPAEA